MQVYNQVFTEDDAKAVYEVVKSQFVTHIGKETKQLEAEFRELFSRRYALACSNGTTALHLALVALNLQGCTIAVPAGAFAAAAFAPAYVNCKTVFIDIDERTWNINPSLLEEECKKQRIDAVIAVHNYGTPYNYNVLKELSEKYKFYIIEDACEAFGASYGDTKAGCLGDVSVFSFYGNKMISGGEGGMLLTDSNNVAEKAEKFKSQAISKVRKFWHEDIGHNFRITNMQSALVLSQLRRADEVLRKASQINKWYRENLKDAPVKFQERGDENNDKLKILPSYWMTSLVHKDFKPEWGSIIARELKERGIDTRPIFPPLPLMPPWEKENRDKRCHVAEKVHDSGITLPSGPAMTEEMVKEVCKYINEIG